VRVLAAMSGGVDSAVAAARAVDAGHDVVGVHLALAEKPATLREGARGCCSVEDARDARRSADVLGIPFYVWDLAARFRADVVDDFVGEYAAGRTPNPCVRCNERVKFSAVQERALALGFDAVCTGHYARLVDGPAGRQLVRAVDVAKDQSYVLGVLTAEQLAHAMFPVGSSTKAEVRAEAAARGLAVADKPDSHDICFIPDGDTAGWLRQRIGERSGPIVDAATGEELGRHDGAYGFTIGQRRGLRLGRPAPDGRPRYVLDITPVTGTVTVGPVEALGVDRVSARGMRWTGPPRGGSFPCAAQVRAHGDAVPATATVDGDGVVVELASAVRGVAPGQTVVLYDGDAVVGAATIDAADRQPVS
jgi:tRNA-uridine 2-sulfurtransferase